MPNDQASDGGHEARRLQLERDVGLAAACD